MAKACRVWVEDTGASLGERVRVADGFFSRFWGLMGQPPLAEGEGLWLEPCDSIHMFFMGFAIDAAYLDAEGQVLKLLHGIRPWRVGPILRKARVVLELPAGKLAQAGVVEGMRLRREALT